MHCGRWRRFLAATLFVRVRCRDICITTTDTTMHGVRRGISSRQQPSVLPILPNLSVLPRHQVSHTDHIDKPSDSPKPQGKQIDKTPAILLQVETMETEHTQSDAAGVDVIQVVVSVLLFNSFTLRLEVLFVAAMQVWQSKPIQ